MSVPAPTHAECVAMGERLRQAISERGIASFQEQTPVSPYSEYTLGGWDRSPWPVWDEDGGRR